MKKIILSLSMVFSTISNSFGSKTNSPSEKRLNLFEKLKKEKVVKIQDSANSGKTGGSGGGYIGPKNSK